CPRPTDSEADTRGWSVQPAPAGGRFPIFHAGPNRARQRPPHVDDQRGCPSLQRDPEHRIPGTRMSSRRRPMTELRPLIDVTDVRVLSRYVVELVFGTARFG